MFEKLVWKHLINTGMDTIAYLPSVANPTEMVNVVQYYSQFTTKMARDQYNVLKPRFDRYDLNNDQAALDFLLDSVESNLREVVSEKLEDNDGFVVAWLQLVKSIKVTNIEHYEKLKQAIKARLPSQYSGENVLELARQFRAYARELDNACMYDHHLTLSMLDIFLLAGGQDNEDYRMELRVVKKKLKTHLETIRHLSYEASGTHMTREGLSYKDICEVAETSYLEQADTGKWPPARNVKTDASAPPATFAAVASAGQTGLSTEVYNLV